jgi:hypothetical protein
MTHATDNELNRLADGSLESVEAERVRRHVASCAECEREVTSIVRLLDQSATLNVPQLPRRDLWPAIAGAELRIRRRRRERWILRLTAVAATIVLVVSAPVFVTSVRQSVHTLWTRVVGGGPAPLSSREVQATMILTRGAQATGDVAFYERRRILMADSLTTKEREAISESSALDARLREIDSLATLAEHEPGNSTRAQSVAAALDAWYFDVQQVRRDLRRLVR